MSAPGTLQATTFRRLATNEHEDLLRHFLRLDTEDRRLRFGGYVGEERLRAYCRRLDRHPGAVVLGCFIAGELRGVGELKPIEDIWPRAAELAVLLEAPFRGRGLGTELCRRLIVRARNRFIARLYMLCLPDNRPVQEMARKLGGELSFYQGEVETRLEPSWPDPASASEEWLDEIDVLLGPGSLPWAGFRPPWWGAPTSVGPSTSLTVGFGCGWPASDSSLHLPASRTGCPTRPAWGSAQPVCVCGPPGSDTAVTAVSACSLSP